MSALIAEQELVQQLKREVNISRRKVSLSVKDIVSFCEQERRVDPLITKMPENPFRDKRNFCGML